MKTLLLLLLFVSLYGAGVSEADMKSPNQKVTLNTTLPDVKLLDSYGKTVSIKEIIGGKVLIISPIYTRCQTACLLITDSVMSVVDKVEGLGVNYNVLTLTFDPDDDQKQMEKFRNTWQLDNKPGWTVAGGGKGEVEKLLKALDFQYTLDGETGEFLHPNLLIVITPMGKISKYIYGVNYDEKNVRLSILAAKKEGSSLTLTEGVLLWCYRYDPLTGKYIFDWGLVCELIGGIAFFISIPFFFWGRLVISKIKFFSSRIFMRKRFSNS